MKDNKPKICFEISEEQKEKCKSFPRGYNLSEKLREALDNIIEVDGCSSR